MPASSARGTIMAKNPYCEVYKAVFSRASDMDGKFCEAVSPAKRMIRLHPALVIVQ
jgi:hypothetical protein